MSAPLTVLDHARRYLAAGLSVIPVRADGSKAPRFSGWREFTSKLPTAEQIDAWFSGSELLGIGVVPGPASGNLVILDFECKGGMPAYAEWLSGLSSDLAEYVDFCPRVRTPSGGMHLWVRLAHPQSGGRLARYASGATKIEVRGEGHQVLAPGCPPQCHKSGLTYEFEEMGWLTE